MDELVVDEPTKADEIDELVVDEQGNPEEERVTHDALCVVNVVGRLPDRHINYAIEARVTAKLRETPRW